MNSTHEHSPRKELTIETYECVKLPSEIEILLDCNDGAQMALKSSIKLKINALKL